MVLTSSFNLNWPDEVEIFLNAQEQTGSVTKQIYSFDCYLAEYDENMNVYYQKLIFIAFLPFILVFAALAFWGIIAALRRDMGIL